MKLSTLLAGLLLSSLLMSQTVTHGPIVGAVTDNSCRVLVRTDVVSTVTVELSTSAAFSSVAASTSVTTVAGKDTVEIADINGLSADTKYYVRALISGTPSGVPAYFKTFPATGTAPHQVFVAGSCLYDLTDADSALFVRAAMYEPKAFLNIGDWGYPDAATGSTDLYATNPPTSFAVDINNHYTFYKMRYESPSSIGFIRTLSTDYVYDDHDYMNDNTAKDAASGFKIGFPDLGAPVVLSQPVQARLNTIKAYQEYFPGYELVDSTEGIYHSFRSGNAEFFVIDTRSMRTPQASAVTKVGGQWVYSPPQGYSFLGANQTAWLRNGLMNSTATWKFIISSDAFNIGLRMTVDSCIKIGGGNVPYWGAGIQGIPTYGYMAWQNYGDCWAGFKEDADSLVNFVKNNNVKNVFVVSGDTHTVGLDDGTNSGIPELNSGNLKKANSEEWVINQAFMGFNIWNKGGSGLCDQSNFSNTFSKIEIFGDDSLRLSAEDASGTEVTGWTFMVDEPYKYDPLYHANRLPKAVNDVVNAVTNDTAVIAPLTNDSDAENDPLFVNLKTTPDNGTATVNPDNTITYVPTANFTGVDTFRYIVCDHSSPSCFSCSGARITVNVGPSSVAEIAGTTLRVYPNPAVNRLFINSTSTRILTMELLNLLGERILLETFSGKTELDVSNISAGDYLLRVTAKDSRETVNMKVSLAK